MPGYTSCKNSRGQTFLIKLGRTVHETQREYKVLTMVHILNKIPGLMWMMGVGQTYNNLGVVGSGRGGGGTNVNSLDEALVKEFYIVLL